MVLCLLNIVCEACGSSGPWCRSLTVMCRGAIWAVPICFCCMLPFTFPALAEHCLRLVNNFNKCTNAKLSMITMIRIKETSINCMTCRRHEMHSVEVALPTRPALPKTVGFGHVRSCSLGLRIRDWVLCCSIRKVIEQPPKVVVPSTAGTVQKCATFICKSQYGGQPAQAGVHQCAAAEGAHHQLRRYPSS